MVSPAYVGDLPALQQLARVCAVYVPTALDITQSDAVRFGDQVVAFASWQVVCDEATLLALAVTAAHRGQGIAQALLNYGERRLWANGIRQGFLEVRASNQVAQRLYQHSGYTAIATRADYYPTDTGREVAIVMHKRFA